MVTCNKDKILNPKTGRCVSKTGKIGKELLKKKKPITTQNRQQKSRKEINSMFRKLIRLDTDSVEYYKLNKEYIKALDQTVDTYSLNTKRCRQAKFWYIPEVFNLNYRDKSYHDSHIYVNKQIRLRSLDFLYNKIKPKKGDIVFWGSTVEGRQYYGLYMWGFLDKHEHLVDSDFYSMSNQGVCYDNFFQTALKEKYENDAYYDILTAPEFMGCLSRRILLNNRLINTKTYNLLRTILIDIC